MKRPVILVLASLLVSGSVFAGNGVSSQIASRVVGADKPAAVRHTSDRGNDHRGGNHPAPPSHGGGHDRRDGGKHHDKIVKGQSQAKDALDKLDGKNDDIK